MLWPQLCNLSQKWVVNKDKGSDLMKPTFYSLWMQTILIVWINKAPVMNSQWSGGQCCSSKAVIFIGGKLASPQCLCLLNWQKRSFWKSTIQMMCWLTDTFFKFLLVSSTPCVYCSPVLWCAIHSSWEPHTQPFNSQSFHRPSAVSTARQTAEWRPQEIYKQPHHCERQRVRASFPATHCCLFSPLQA